MLRHNQRLFYFCKIGIRLPSLSVASTSICCYSDYSRNQDFQPHRPKGATGKPLLRTHSATKQSNFLIRPQDEPHSRNFSKVRKHDSDRKTSGASKDSSRFKYHPESSSKKLDDRKYSSPKGYYVTQTAEESNSRNSTSTQRWDNDRQTPDKISTSTTKKSGSDRPKSLRYVQEGKNVDETTSHEEKMPLETALAFNFDNIPRRPYLDKPNPEKEFKIKKEHRALFEIAKAMKDSKGMAQLMINFRKAANHDLYDMKFRLRLAGFLFLKAKKYDDTTFFNNQIAVEVIGDPKKFGTNGKTVEQKSDDWEDADGKKKSFIRSEVLLIVLERMVELDAKYPKSIECTLEYFEFLIEKRYIGFNRKEIVDFFVKQSVDNYENWEFAFNLYQKMTNIGEKPVSSLYALYLILKSANKQLDSDQFEKEKEKILGPCEQHRKLSLMFCLNIVNGETHKVLRMLRDENINIYEKEHEGILHNMRNIATMDFEPLILQFLVDQPESETQMGHKASIYKSLAYILGSIKNYSELYKLTKRLIKEYETYEKEQHVHMANHVHGVISFVCAFYRSKSPKIRKLFDEDYPDLNLDTERRIRHPLHHAGRN